MCLDVLHWTKSRGDISEAGLPRDIDPVGGMGYKEARYAFVQGANPGGWYTRYQMVPIKRGQWQHYHTPIENPHYYRDVVIYSDDGYYYPAAIHIWLDIPVDEVFLGSHFIGARLNRPNGLLTVNWKNLLAYGTQYGYRVAVVEEMMVL